MNPIVKKIPNSIQINAMNSCESYVASDFTDVWVRRDKIQSFVEIFSKCLWRFGSIP